MPAFFGIEAGADSRSREMWKVAELAIGFSRNDASRVECKPFALRAHLTSMPSNASGLGLRANRVGAEIRGGQPRARSPSGGSRVT
jgi:hypothetical protein